MGSRRHGHVLQLHLVGGEGFVRTMLAVTGLSSAEFGSGVLTAGQWLGFVAGSLVVMFPVIAGSMWWRGSAGPDARVPGIHVAWPSSAWAWALP